METEKETYCSVCGDFIENDNFICDNCKIEIEELMEEENVET